MTTGQQSVNWGTSLPQVSADCPPHSSEACRRAVQARLHRIRKWRNMREILSDEEKAPAGKGKVCFVTFPKSIFLRKIPCQEILHNAPINLQREARPMAVLRGSKKTCGNRNKILCRNHVQENDLWKEKYCTVFFYQAVSSVQAQNTFLNLAYL